MRELNLGQAMTRKEHLANAIEKAESYSSAVKVVLKGYIGQEDYFSLQNLGCKINSFHIQPFSHQQSHIGFVTKNGRHLWFSTLDHGKGDKIFLSISNG